MLEEKLVRNNITAKSCSSEGDTEESSPLAFLGHNLQIGIDKYNNPKNNDKAKMPGKKSRSTAINLVVNIHPGITSAAQKQAWARFWQKMIIGVKKETGE